MRGKCNCYVRYLSDEDQYCLHYGAHEKDCLVYRPSLDPVDRCHDDEFRAMMIAHIESFAHESNRILTGCERLTP